MSPGIGAGKQIKPFICISVAIMSPGIAAVKKVKPLFCSSGARLSPEPEAGESQLNHSFAGVWQE